MTALMVNTPSESVGMRDIDGFTELVEVVRLEMPDFSYSVQETNLRIISFYNYEYLPGIK